jgi:hypothetical protein
MAILLTSSVASCASLGYLMHARKMLGEATALHANNLEALHKVRIDVSMAETWCAQE